jgi:hypothetical protein
MSSEILQMDDKTDDETGSGSEKKLFSWLVPAFLWRKLFPYLDVAVTFLLPYCLFSTPLHPKQGSKYVRGATAKRRRRSRTSYSVSPPGLYIPAAGAISRSGCLTSSESSQGFDSDAKPCTVGMQVSAAQTCPRRRNNISILLSRRTSFQLAHCFGCLLLLPRLLLFTGRGSHHLHAGSAAGVPFPSSFPSSASSISSISSWSSCSCSLCSTKAKARLPASLNHGNTQPPNKAKRSATCAKLSGRVRLL